MSDYLLKLREMLGDPSLEVRCTAAEWLIRSGETVPPDILRDMALSGREEWGLSAIPLLVRYGKQCIRILEEMAKTGSVMVQERATSELASIICPESVDALCRIAQTETGWFWGMRGLAMLASRVRRGEIDAESAMSVTKEILLVVVDTMQHHSNHIIREAAAKVLGILGQQEATIPLVNAFYAEKNPMVRRGILFALASVGIDHEREEIRREVESIIESALCSPDRDVHRWIAEGLSLPLRHVSDKDVGWLLSR